ncbi:TPA: hypothetical protein L5597_004152 [Pseudomonas aeruginosa]|uniref:Uncharacterized protein n=1 Tax=Pseudomonas phage YMC11/02/R656 TaxID=1755689 RepID=A0A0S2SY59_9CAUD|nr:MULTISPECIES: hypothetical protein [Pseudomonas]YP_009187406.1 hypothetical protein AU162_gp009 [Pseudomonas phage YMC11/02/R656]ALP47830.1 hypothetical protein BPPAER656_00090 [Pseudomonas phage YMC11/02/R656]MBH4255544.1 hypothetical protein [Pseudomonas aeruginosa]MBI7359791.1 hypothetical protein [Pseudomonas aeruginosa]MCS8361522.1 hypothetical protein [Pseudomonas aeruginosa]MCS8644878.1 hypothetical protein [Pseudomonas aeruginosa]
MSIDWTKAPEGTTHYHIGEDINPWRKIEGTVAYEHYRGKWLRVNSFNEGCMPGYYVPIPQETWDGQGLPPVGTVCEVKHRDIGWVRCEIVAHKSFSCGGLTHAIAWIDENTLDQSQGLRFRQLRTPEQIAAEEREKAVGDMAMSIQGVPYQYPTLYALFDAGYRRQEEGK